MPRAPRPTGNVGLCPNGSTITVVFKPGFADWRALFGDIVPAHIARTVGWNTGFTGPAQTISGSWYSITSYNEGQSLVLTRNPKYWSTPGKLDKIVFQFFSDDTQLVPALQNKEVNVINPSTVNLSIVQTANQVLNAMPKSTWIRASEFEHFDFNEANPYLAKVGCPSGHRLRCTKPADDHRLPARSVRSPRAFSHWGTACS